MSRSTTRHRPDSSLRGSGTTKPQRNTDPWSTRCGSGSRQSQRLPGGPGPSRPPGIRTERPGRRAGRPYACSPPKPPRARDPSALDHLRSPVPCFALPTVTCSGHSTSPPRASWQATAAEPRRLMTQRPDWARTTRSGRASR